MNIVLTEKRRHEVCIHEAAHAVIYALGGSIVYDVGVAPIGCEEWSAEGRNGGGLSDLWGVCRANDAANITNHFWWNEDLGGYECDRQGYIDLLKWNEHVTPNGKEFLREERRILRAWICGSIAGPVADAIGGGEEQPGGIWLEPEYMEGGDLTVAEALSRFLPYRKEYEFLTVITERALREPELWGMVLKLADEIDKAGFLGREGGSFHRLQGLLPEPRRDWPPSPLKWRREELNRQRKRKAGPCVVKSTAAA